MKKTSFLTGIKGVGMTALAVYLKQKGDLVFGSDVEEHFPTDEILKSEDIKILKGFTKANITRKIDRLIVTGAHGGLTNPEVKKANSLSIPVFTHGEFLGKISEKKSTISVAGCHGKTTTSAFLASVLYFAEYDPSFIIGAPLIRGLGSAGRYGSGRYLVLEADEYMTCPLTIKKPRFLWQKPEIAIITNIDYDHPDAFTDINKTKEAFLSFIDNVSTNGLVIVCIDDRNIQSIIPQIDKPVITYGFSPRADYRISRYHQDKSVSFIKIEQKDVEIGEYALSIHGAHNALNSLAVSIAANQIGIKWSRLSSLLTKFTGTGRRFEKVANVGGINFYDDYAHHPNEIKVTIDAFKKMYPDKRLILIFQPHTYSRTKALLEDFTRAFTLADMVFITDIFSSAREEKDPKITSAILVNRINRIKNNAIYIKDHDKLIKRITNELKSGDLLVTMGAGDVNKYHEKLLRSLK